MNIGIKYILISLFFISTFAQKWTIRERFDLMAYDARFDAAINELNLEYRTIAISFIHHRVLFWKVMMKQDHQSLNEFTTQSDVLIKQIQQRKKQHYGHYFLAECYLEKAMISAFKKDKIYTLKYLKTAYDLAKKSLKAEPDVVEAYRIIGIIQMMLGIVPTEYQSLLKILGYEPSVEEGYKTFRKAFKGKWLLLENKLTEYFIQKHIFNNIDSAQTIIEELNSIENPPILFRFLKGQTLLNKRKNEELLKFLKIYIENPLINNDIVRFPQMIYLTGKSLFYKQKYIKAIKSFDLFLQYYRGKQYILDAKLKKGFSLLFLGKNSQAEKIFQEVAKAEAIFEIDKAAKTLAQNIIKYGLSSTEIKILKARFLIDGGYFDEAIKMLLPLKSQIIKLSGDEKTLLFYYLARVYHFKGKLLLAKQYYQNTIQQNTKKYQWMRSYASYYIATILEKQEDWPNARAYYKQAIKLSPHPYRNSLEALAKAGLNRLRNKKYDVTGQEK